MRQKPVGPVTTARKGATPTPPPRPSVYRTAGWIAAGLLGVAAIAGAVILWPDSMEVSLTRGISERSTQDGWSIKVPGPLAGKWVEGTRCDDEEGVQLNFVNGGYRWLRPPRKWGFARGVYEFDQHRAQRVRFRMTNLNSEDDTPEAEFIMTLSGDFMKKYNPTSGRTVSYKRCE